MTHCPMCRYSLEGLPRKHDCPECGFACDRDATAVRPRQFTALRAVFLVWVVGYAVMLVDRASRYPWGLSDLLRSVPELLPFISAPFVVFWLDRGSRPTFDAAVVSSEAVTFYTPNGEHVLRLDHLQAVRWIPIKSRIELKEDGVWTPLLQPQRVGASRTTMRRLMRAINEEIRRRRRPNDRTSA